ncbi:MAG TPA: type II secretion system protein GspD [Thiothrix sp.]|nr:type II secretion system protein GspD [Thiothrix sp.]
MNIFTTQWLLSKTKYLAIPLIIIGLATQAQGEQLNLRGVDINVLIETVSRITGKNFVVDPRIKGTATVVTGRDMSDEELYDTFLSVLQVHGFAVVETGGITKIIPNNIAKQQTHPIIENTKNQSSEKLVTRLVQIEHVSALSIVSALRPIARGIQIQHHAESNSVIMSGRVDDLKKLETIIIRMDRADEKQIEVIPLRYADAKKVVQTIKALDKTGVKGKLSTKNKVSADDRTNSLLVTGDKATRTRIRRIVEKIDIPKQKEGNTKVIYLRYAKATDLATVLQGISKTSQIANKDGKAKSAQNPGASSGGGGNNIDIQADESSNSLIITADPEVLKNLEVVIAKLDVRRAQVMIETIVAEVSTNLSSALGIQFGFNGLAGNSSGPVGVTNFSSAGASNILTVGAAIASGAASAAPGALLGLGGESGGMQFVTLLNALSSDAATNILSTPTLVTMDNEEASIVVGQNIPLLTGSFSSTGNGGASASNPFSTIERQDIGLTLKVTPQINEGTSIKLAIEQETSSLAASNAGAADLITNKRSITTNVMVEDGEVLVLGGLIENTFRDTQEKIPVLGDLPVVGNLFRHDKTNKERQNLMVFIHPVIMRTPETASAYTKQKYSAMQHQQKGSRVLGRGTFKHRANRLPNINKLITQDPIKQPYRNTINELPVPTQTYRSAPQQTAPQTQSTAVPFLDDMVD